MTIADTIRSLKPGDRVRVTREQDVERLMDPYVIIKDGPYIYGDDPTITSIEVIERPLQVGDEVCWLNRKEVGTLTAIGRTLALVQYDGTEMSFPLSDLRRAS